jgi:hypothetical protein
VTGIAPFLERCVGCGQTTNDIGYSRHDREPRCGACERRADHERRLLVGDAWYRRQIIAWAKQRWPDWEREHGWAICADLFADTRALGGWKAVGVELERPSQPIKTRPCRVCGATTTSVSNYFCADCHFRGWWGQWRDVASQPVEPRHEQLTIGDAR